MKYDDLPEFTSKLNQAARSMGKNINEGDPEAYFKLLNDLSRELVFSAIDRVVKSRPIEEDSYLRTAMITVPEILSAAENLEDEAIAKRKYRCDQCGGTGWLTEEVNGRLVAHPCVCLVLAARHTLQKKKRPGSEQEALDRHREIILRSYEAHEKKMGGMKDEPPF